MTVYRVQEPSVVYVEALGRHVTLLPGRELDDTYPEDAAVIKEWGKRGTLRAANVSPKK